MSNAFCMKCRNFYVDRLLIEIGVVRRQFRDMSSPPCTPAMRKKSTALPATSLSRSRTYSHWWTGRGIPVAQRTSPPRGILAFASSSPANERGNFLRLRGRSFGCGDAIKNSPVSGAWIADGTDGHGRACRVSDRLSRPSLYRATPVSLFIPSPFAFPVYRHDSYNWHLYQQVCQLPARFLARYAKIYSAFFRSRGFYLFYYIYRRISIFACDRLTLYLFRIWYLD